MKYHFINSTGDVVESNNIATITKAARKEPTNYVWIQRKDGYKIQVMGAKQYHKRLLKKTLFINAKFESKFTINH